MWQILQVLIAVHFYVTTGSAYHTHTGYVTDMAIAQVMKMKTGVLTVQRKAARVLVRLFQNINLGFNNTHMVRKLIFFQNSAPIVKLTPY